MTIHIDYQSNYNGCDVFNDEDEMDEDVDRCCDLAEQIVDRMYDECDEEGFYYGSKTEAVDIITAIAQKVYGDGVKVIITFDEFSS